MADTLAGDGTGGEPTRAAAGEVSRPGRIDVADRVYTKVAEHTAALVIGVPRRDTTVDVTQYRDGIALRVRTPLPVPSLDDTAAIQAGQPVLDRVAEIQNTLRDQIGHLSGRDVVRVDVTVTGAAIARQKRVK